MEYEGFGEGHDLHVDGAQSPEDLNTPDTESFNAINPFLSLVHNENHRPLKLCEQQRGNPQSGAGGNTAALLTNTTKPQAVASVQQVSCRTY